MIGFELSVLDRPANVLPITVLQYAIMTVLALACLELAASRLHD